MGLFSRIFPKKELTIEPIDLSFLRNDIHSHLIPGIDDGSPDMETTIMLLKKFIDLGYKKVITTPHVMSDYYKNTPEIILSGLDKVNAEIKKNNLDIKVEAAAEYNLEPEFEDLLEKNNLLTFGTDRYLLFELSFFDEPPRLNDIIWKMIEKDFSPVLAHVERYAYWHKDYDKIEEMINHNGPVIFDCQVDPNENCFPMIPSGKPHNQMILGPKDQEENKITGKGKSLV